MLSKRIIPCLDVRAGILTKGIKFQGNVDIGDPVEAARQYYEQGADEIVFYDITASSDGRNIMIDVVRRVAERIFIPFSVGGGIRTVDDMRQVILAGAEKVLLFTCHSLEQVKRLPERFFDVLAAAAPEVTAIHLEPFGFQIERKSSVSKKHAAFIKGSFFNMNLAEVLRAAEKRKKLTVRVTVLNAINPQEENPTSIAVWDNRRP